MTILIVSFLAWVLTVLAPCVLPLLPIILWASATYSKDRFRPYIIIFSLSISIVLFSLLFKASTLLIWFNQAILTTISWMIIIFFWIITLFPDLWKSISNKIGFSGKSNEVLGKSSQKNWFWGSVLIWLSLWPVFSSCSPTYAIILAVILPISFVFGLINLVAYVLWLAVILLAIAILWQRFAWKLRWISDPKSKFKKVLWVIFLLVWLAIATWFDKKIEASLIEKWFIWWGTIEQRFLDSIEKDIDNLDSNNEAMKDNEVKKNYNELEIAYFAWGCFWCIESIMDAQKWVESAISWYAGWDKGSANYDEVSLWKTSHREAVKVIYDPEIISYKELVEIFMTQIDPTDIGWQFADRWFHYTTAIYYEDDKQREIAENILEKLDNSWEFDSDIVTAIEEFSTFFEAEEHHQDYAQKQSFRYKMYKKWSWREWYIDDNEQKYKEIFNEYKKDMDNLKSRLTPLEFEVTQNDATEKPFDNKYWDHKQDWIYVDIVDWTPLFSSKDKYDSGSGWPAFTRPIDDALLAEKEDGKLFTTRTEIRSKNADSHLWHVFDDGPEEEGGLRYCINSAALDFVWVDELEEKGYWEYKVLFQ